MATITRFENLEAWKKAREATRVIYERSKQGPFAGDYGLRDQIRRASVSAMSNIAEGFERDGTSEFLQFLAMAKASAGEVESQLYVALDQRYVTREEFTTTKDLVSSAKRLIAGLMIYLRRCGIRGAKYKRSFDQKPETGN